MHLACNNAGVCTGGDVEECEPGDWAWIVGVNLMGVVHGCEVFLPYHKRQGDGGHVVNTASMAGLLGGMAGWAPYNATKFAVVGRLVIEAVRANRPHIFTDARPSTATESAPPTPSTKWAVRGDSRANSPNAPST